MKPPSVPGTLLSRSLMGSPRELRVSRTVEQQDLRATQLRLMGPGWGMGGIPVDVAGRAEGRGEFATVETGQRRDRTGPEALCATDEEHCAGRARAGDDVREAIVVDVTGRAHAVPEPRVRIAAVRDGRMSRGQA